MRIPHFFVVFTIPLAFLTGCATTCPPMKENGCPQRPPVMISSGKYLQALKQCRKTKRPTIVDKDGKVIVFECL